MHAGCAVCGSERRVTRGMACLSAIWQLCRCSRRRALAAALTAAFSPSSCSRRSSELPSTGMMQLDVHSTDSRSTPGQQQAASACHCSCGLLQGYRGAVCSMLLINLPVPLLMPLSLQQQHACNAPKLPGSRALIWMHAGAAADGHVHQPPNYVISSLTERAELSQQAGQMQVKSQA